MLIILEVPFRTESKQPFSFISEIRRVSFVPNKAALAGNETLFYGLSKV